MRLVHVPENIKDRPYLYMWDGVHHSMQMQTLGMNTLSLKAPIFHFGDEISLRRDKKPRRIFSISEVFLCTSKWNFRTKIEDQNILDTLFANVLHTL